MPPVSSFSPLSTNSQVRSWTQSGPVLSQSTLCSIPYVTSLVPLASDWPWPPSAAAARESRAVSGCPPIWGTQLLWPQRKRRRQWTDPPTGCSTGSPGRPGSGGHCSAPETAPETTQREEKEKKTWNLISGCAHRRIIQSAQYFISLFSSPLYSSQSTSFPSQRTCAASGAGCRARASVISKGVRRSRAAHSNTGRSMAPGMSRKWGWKT